MSTLLSIAYATAVNGTAYDVTSYVRTPHGVDAVDASNPYVVATDVVEVSSGLLTVKDGNDGNWSIAGVSFGSFGNQVGGAWDATTGCAAVQITFTTGALDDVSTGTLFIIHRTELQAQPYPLTLEMVDNGDDTWTLHVLAQGFDGTIEDESVIFGRSELEGIETNVRLEWQCGTVVGDFSDVTADGFIHVYWNGTLILDLTSLDLYISDDQAGPNYANGFSIGYSGLMGTVSSVRVADSLCSNSSRNLLTGSTHEVTGNDNVITGTFGTLIGDESVLHNLDGTPRTKTKTHYFGVFADEIELSGPLTIADESISYAEMQHVSAASRLLGRGSSGGAGDVEEIALGSGLTMSGTTLTASLAGGSVSAIDVERLHRAQQGLAVYSGCEVTEDNTGAGMDVDVSAGHIRLTTGVGILVTAGEVTLDAAHATLDRLDLVWVNTSGTLGKTTGTAAASPEPPSIPSNSVLLALVSVPATDTTISNAQITDKRTYTKLPQFVRKASDESVSGSTSLQADNELLFPVAASETWEFEFNVFYLGNTTGDFRCGLKFPTTPTQISYGIMGPAAAAAGSPLVGDVANRGDITADAVTGQVQGADTVGAWVLIKGLLRNSTNTGNVVLWWAQGTSDGTNTTVKAGSRLTAIPW